MSLPILPVVPLFGLAVKLKVAVDVPSVTAGSSQVWLEPTSHAHPVPVVTRTSPAPPRSEKLKTVGDTR